LGKTYSTVLGEVLHVENATSCGAAEEKLNKIKRLVQFEIVEGDQVLLDEIGKTSNG
jgi:hypothetical protein